VNGRGPMFHETDLERHSPEWRVEGRKDANFVMGGFVSRRRRLAFPVGGRKDGAKEIVRRRGRFHEMTWEQLFPECGLKDGKDAIGRLALPG